MISLRKALCLGMDPELFFFSEEPEDIAMAKELCAGCPVREPCLELALAIPASDDKWGVFAGTTPDERVQIRHTTLGQSSRMVG